MDSWADAYFKGVIDSELNQLDKDVISGYAYYLQLSEIILHPSVDFAEELLLDDEAMFAMYDGYVKGVLETASGEVFDEFVNIFDTAVDTALKEYDEDAAHYDEWYVRPDDFPTVFVNKYRMVDVDKASWVY